MPLRSDNRPPVPGCRLLPYSMDPLWRILLEQHDMRRSNRDEMNNSGLGRRKPHPRLLFAFGFSLALILGAIAPPRLLGQTPPAGTVVGWGQRVILPEKGVYTNLVARLSHNIALRMDGRLAAWGNNGLGECLVPRGLDSLLSIAAGWQHTLGLKGDGTVVAWGLNYNHQTNVPPGLDHVVAISAGQFQSLALKDDGTVVPWGADGMPELVPPPGLTNIVAIGCGFWHDLTVTDKGTVLAWGDNSRGQTNVPPDLSNVVAVSGGYYHSQALCRDGTVVAWGVNDSGQLQGRRRQEPRRRALPGQHRGDLRRDLFRRQ